MGRGPLLDAVGLSRWVAPASRMLAGCLGTYKWEKLQQEEMQTTGKKRRWCPLAPLLIYNLDKRWHL